MPSSRVLRVLAAAVLGLAAGGAAWVRAAPIEPFLDVKAVRNVHSQNYDVWGITVTSRGAETIGEVRVEPVAGPLHVVGAPAFQGLKAGWSTIFRVQVDDPASSNAVVRIVMSGRVERTYEVPLVEKR